MNINLKYVVGVMGAVIIALFLLLQKSCNNASGLSSMLNKSQDSLHQSLNKLGQQTTYTTELSGSISDLKKLNSQKDSSLKKLQALVDKHTASATVLNTATTSHGEGKTTVSIDPTTNVTERDTAKKIDRIFVYPTYKTAYKTAWDTVSVVAKKDSIKVNYTVFNEFDVTHDWVSQGFFKPRILNIKVVNKNPNTKTIALKSFTAEEPKKKRWIDWLIGGAVVVIGESLLRK